MGRRYRREVLNSIGIFKLGVYMQKKEKKRYHDSRS